MVRGRVGGAPLGRTSGSMTVLALDTATGACSVAVWRDGKVLSGRSLLMERGHAETLMPMVRRAMDEAEVRFDELTLIAVTVGPGAFTGLRVGLAAARGMALAARLPCIGTTTLEAIAAAVPDKRRRGRDVLVALDTKRGDFYVQAFAADGQPLGAPRAGDEACLNKLVGNRPVSVAGDAAVVAVRALRAAGITAEPVLGCEAADAAWVAAIATRRWREINRHAGMTTTSSTAESLAPPASRHATSPAPLYLRPPEAKVAAGGGRRRP